MGKKSGKSGKDKDKGKRDDTGFSFGGFDIPQALRNNGVTVDNLARHPLVAGLAAMALETLASQIRARAAAAGAATPNDDTEAAEPTPAPAPKTARKPAAAKTRKTTAKPAATAKPARKPAARKPAGSKASPKKAG